jgi:hypothetical protein
VRPNQNYKNPAYLISLVVPGVAGAVLYHRIAGFEVNLGAIVQLEPDLSGEDILEIDRKGQSYPPTNRQYNPLSWVHPVFRAYIGDQIIMNVLYESQQDSFYIASLPDFYELGTEGVLAINLSTFQPPCPFYSLRFLQKHIRVAHT